MTTTNDSSTTKSTDGGPAFPITDSQCVHAVAAAAILGIDDSAERDRLYTEARARAAAGMSLRDAFALAVIPSLLSTHPASNGRVTPGQHQRRLDELALEAFNVADAMLRARGA